MKKLLLIPSLVLALAFSSCNDGKKENTQTDTVAENAEMDEAEEPNNKTAKLNEGDIAPNFTLNDIDGEPLALSSLQGKYVIADFWGSWCVWCLFGMEEMQKNYEKYSDQMEILGIDCGDTEEDWKNAVKDLQLKWKNVRCPDEDNLTDVYGIEGFPTKILIDPKGKIEKIYVGEDPSLYAYLDSLFKK